MSCFMLDDRHFAYLALAWARYQRALSVTVMSEDIAHVARVLKEANAASYEARYPGKCEPCPSCGERVCAAGPHPGYGPSRVKVCPFADVAIPPADSFAVKREELRGAVKVTIEPFAPVTVIKQAHCFDYQACEAPTWERSRAKEINDLIIGRAIASLPGYDAAPWGIK